MINKKPAGQRGFGVVEGLVVVLVIVVLGAGAFFIYRKNHTNKAAYAPNTTTSSSQQTSDQSKTATYTPQEAVIIAQKTYADYLEALTAANSDPSRTQPVAQVGLAAVKANLSAELYTKAAAVTQATPFSCTAQYVADKYTASLKSSDQKSAVVAMSISNGGGQATTGMSVTVDLTSLKISSVSCPN